MKKIVKIFKNWFYIDSEITHVSVPVEMLHNWYLLNSDIINTVYFDRENNYKKLRLHEHNREMIEILCTQTKMKRL